MISFLTRAMFTPAGANLLNGIFHSAHLVAVEIAADRIVEGQLLRDVRRHAAIEALVEPPLSSPAVAELARREARDPQAPVSRQREAGRRREQQLVPPVAVEICEVGIHVGAWEIVKFLRIPLFAVSKALHVCH